MRLIDADALLEAIHKIYGDNHAPQGIINLITNALTVEQDSEPVAYWDGKEDFISLDTYQEYKKLGFHINCTQPLYTSPPKQDSEPVYQCFYPHDGWSNVSKEMYEDTDYSCDKRILYTSPPKREWRGLSDEEVEELCDKCFDDIQTLLYEYQAKLKELNHD